VVRSVGSVVCSRWPFRLRGDPDELRCGCSPWLSPLVGAFRGHWESRSASAGVGVCLAFRVARQDVGRRRGRRRVLVGVLGAMKATAVAALMPLSWSRFVAARDGARVATRSPRVAVGTAAVLWSLLPCGGSALVRTPAVPALPDRYQGRAASPLHGSYAGAAGPAGQAARRAVSAVGRHRCRGLARGPATTRRGGSAVSSASGRTRQAVATVTATRSVTSPYPWAVGGSSKFTVTPHSTEGVNR